MHKINQELRRKLNRAIVEHIFNADSSVEQYTNFLRWASNTHFLPPNHSLAYKFKSTYYKSGEEQDRILHYSISYYPISLPQVITSVQWHQDFSSMLRTARYSLSSKIEDGFGRLNLKTKNYFGQLDEMVSELQRQLTLARSHYGNQEILAARKRRSDGREHFLRNGGLSGMIKLVSERAKTENANVQQP